MNTIRPVALGVGVSVAAVALLSASGDRSGTDLQAAGTSQTRTDVPPLFLTGETACSLARREAEKYGALSDSRVEVNVAGEVARWQEHRYLPDGPAPESNFRRRPSDLPAFVCVFHGDLSTAAIGPIGLRSQYSRITFIVTPDGVVTLDSIGKTDPTSAETPGDLVRIGNL